MFFPHVVISLLSYMYWFVYFLSLKLIVEYLECSRIRNPQQIIFFLLFSLSESEKKPLTVLNCVHSLLYLAG